jgi:hypothetical protein
VSKTTLAGLRERKAWLVKQLQICDSEIERGERAAAQQGDLPGVPEPTPTERRRSSGEQWWENFELDRVAHGRKLGLDLRAEPRPPIAAINTLFARAFEITGFEDRTVRKGDGSTGELSKFTQLEDLLFLYFADEKFGTLDQNGAKRDRPWPLKLFFAAGVLERYKRDLVERSGAPAP